MMSENSTSMAWARREERLREQAGGLAADPPTIAEQLREAFPFDIVKEKMYTMVADEEEVEYPGAFDPPPKFLHQGKYELLRSDTGETVHPNSVKGVYEPHQLKHVIALVESAAGLFASGDEVPDMKCHWDNGHIVSLVPGQEYRQSIFGEEDGIFPRCLIKAGYDGTCFEVSVGFYRDLCRNMSMLSSVKAARVKIKHTHALNGKLELLTEDLDSLRGSWKEIIRTMQMMEGVKIDLFNALRATLGKREEVKEGASRTIFSQTWDGIVDRIRREAQRSGRSPVGRCSSLNVTGTDHPTVTGYQFYQGVQGYYQWEGRRHSKPSDYQRMLLALDNKTVAKAERYVLACV